MRTCRAEFNCCQVGCRGAGVETDWVSERAHVAEDMGHTGEIKERIGGEVRVVGAVESGIGRQRQASSCAVSSCILGRRTASVTVAALDSSGSQRFAVSFATPEEENCMQ